MKRQSQKRDTDQFSRGDERIVLPQVWSVADLIGHLNESIGFPRHGRYHDDDVISLLLGLNDAPGHIANPA